jgi:serine protease Do
MRPLAPLLVLALALTGACAREAPPVEPAQKMAYRVKPAVVRVNARAEGDFHYGRDAILRARDALAARGIPAAIRSLPGEHATLRAAAGESGSGFVVDSSGVVVTSAHVVSPARPAAREATLRTLARNGAIGALARHMPLETLRSARREGVLDAAIDLVIASARLENRLFITDVELSNGERHPFEIVSYSPPLASGGADVALLRIAGRNLPAVGLGNSDAVRLQDPVWVIGYPAAASSRDDLIGGWLARESDLEATLNPGVVTAIRRDVRNERVFQTNAAIYYGNSGGPAVDQRGAVIGISTWGHSEAEQIKFLVPVNVVRALLAEAKIVPERRSEFQQAYDRALELIWEGKWRDAHPELVRANALYPGSPELVRFLQEAERRRGGAPSIPSRRAAAATAGAGLAAIAAIAIYALALRRRTTLLHTAPLPSALAPEAESTSGSGIVGRLTILNGSLAGRNLALGGSGIRIGREPAVCEILLDDPKVSRLHAEIVAVEGRVLLIDRNSSNGTFVNDRRIDRAWLADGDIIHFGGRKAVAAAFRV